MYLYTIKEHPYELARHIATVLHTTAGYPLRWETYFYNQASSARLTHIIFLFNVNHKVIFDYLFKSSYMPV